MAQFFDTEELLILLLDELDKILENLIKAYGRELENQGHIDTGRLIDTAEAKTDLTPTSAEGILLLQDYYEDLERRFSASEIDFSNAAFYDLVRYFRRKLADDPEKAAANTFRAWQREGRPTRASTRFSRTGNRVRPLGIVLDELDLTINQLIEDGVDKVFDLQYKVAEDLLFNQIGRTPAIKI